MPFGEVHSRGEGTGKPLQPDPAAPLVSNIAQPLGHTRKPRADPLHVGRSRLNRVAVLLPGMEAGPESGPDHCAEAIAEIRGSMNRLRQDEAAELQRALRLMRAKDVRSFLHGGVELVRVPG